ncbi:MAG: large conductance mechanosensitive channel protein MscL [Alphaproteobacteria bacterium]|nr:large conductance mechanosensitive channel protein MscL [Alphaproteobacteria bacterium]
MWKEFREFAIKGNVVDLAVGIIIGAAFTAIVTSLVNDVVMPPIGWAMGGVDFSNYYIDLTHLSAKATEAAGGAADPKALATFETLKAAQEGGHAVIGYGKFLNAIINFLIVAFSIFLIVRWINSLKRKQAADPTPPAAPPAPDIVLLTEIRDLLAKR